MRRAALLLPIVLLACADETISGYADRDAVYVLQELNGAIFDASASISFPATGRAEGQAPCNGWSAEQTAPYPWIELGPITATEMGCSELALEQAFFGALGRVRFAEVSGPLLILSDETGAEMVFRAR
jgi:heat shock protein HslJ